MLVVCKYKIASSLSFYSVNFVSHTVTNRKQQHPVKDKLNDLLKTTNIVENSCCKPGKSSLKENSTKE